MKKIFYWKRIIQAYVLRSNSQLTFWHESPEVNIDFKTDDIGSYYMKFHQKADYDSICDMDGIPMLDYKGAIGPQYNPIAIAQWGLGNYNLLPGQANIYYKGSSVGETYLNTKSTKNIKKRLLVCYVHNS